ncbi:putative ABC transport system ATP-binding protein [Methylobacillus rhizosphaerae]|uniref:Putative ABC transport system ATP-binding protein n=1 Tax=Methylobacillus rhizosphaerae TaxID=551994 RepID=A0A238ZQN1_9PROT|nr:ABC transporter ATP-binding protein [Methylobacillus rhizosphaerae]SNR85499.1 putative ABC transport system ATP-binding protein [Methylobacillus rhizosphaerae]
MAMDKSPALRVMSDIELEEMLARQKLQRGMFWRLLPLLRPVRHFVIGAIVAEIVLVALIFLRPYLIEQVIDHGMVRSLEGLYHLNTHIMLWALVGMIVSWAGRFGLAGLSQFLSGSAAIRVLNGLRVSVFNHVQHLSVGYFDRTKSGRIVSRIDRDVDSLEPLMIQGPPELLSALLRSVVAGILLWLTSPVLFLSLASVIPLLLAATWLFKHLAQSNYARVAENRARFTAHLVETVAGVRLIKQAVQEASNRQRYRLLIEDFINALIRNTLMAGWFSHFTGILTTLGMMLLIVFGGREVALGHISFGQMAASMFYVFMFLGPLQELGDLFERYINGVASAQRIFLLLDTQPEIRDASSPASLSNVGGNVEFRDVVFSYHPHGENPVIRHLNLKVEAGEVLAIVGPTGHGKSTLVQLLTRFYEVQGGAVLVDGKDVRTLAQHELRRHVGVVLQDNVLFSGSILDNLRLARPKASETELVAAAGALGVHEIISRLPHGYHTEVGALGSHLSHGQRQLVCLVRAYLADPAILILDEATSAVDIQTERKIQHALRQLCEGRTAIIIAHRLATIRDADRIAVIRDGQVVEQGMHTDLMQQGGHYAALYRAYEAGQEF